MSLALNSVVGGNLLRWDSRRKPLGASPFYEIYYLKLADPRHRWSFWARYTLLSPKTGGPGNASLWGIFVRQETPEKVECVAIKKTYRLGEVDLVHAERFIDLGGGYLSLDSAKGVLQDSDHRLEWDLRFEDPSTSLCLYPSPLLYKLPFPKTKFLEPRLSTFVSGSIKKDNEEFYLEHHKASQAHVWGTHYALRWAWGNCNDFVEDPTALFEGFTAQVPLVGDKWVSPPLSLFYFVFEGKIYQANGVWKWLKNKSTPSLLEWKFSATCGDTRFDGTLTRELADIVGLEYQGPQGEKRFCHNSMLASLTIQILRSRPKGWVPYKKLTSKTAAFETLAPEPDPRVRFVL